MRFQFTNDESLFDYVMCRFIFWRCKDRRYWYAYGFPGDYLAVTDDFGNLVPVVY